MKTLNNMTPLYIFDLDDTLRDAKHRHHLVEGADKQGDSAAWNAFYMAAEFDPPIQSIVRLFNSLLYSGADIILMTGSSDIARQITVDWLLKHTAYRDELLMMRPHTSRTPDLEIKKSWYKAMSDADRARLVCVFEDRQRVVDMWRSIGVTCCQVAPSQY